jgi:hypothetical protein
MRVFLVAMSALVLTQCTNSCDPDPVPPRTAVDCIPQEVRSAPVRAAPRLGSIKVYIDGSQSMSGYVRPGAGTANPMADLLRLVRRFADRHSVAPGFAAFGRKITEIDPDGAVQRYSQEAAYTCSGCDKQESRIDNVLDEAAKAPTGSLTLIVTDLWLDNQSFSGSAEVALGGPLQDLLRGGRSVGIVGAMAPFSGSVYGVPGAGTYRLSGERPLFIIASGSMADVLALKNALFASKSPLFTPERARFSLYSTEWPTPPIRPIALRAVGNGVANDNVLGSDVQTRSLQFRLQQALAKKQNGRIEAMVRPAKALAEGRIGEGPLRATARVWKLSSGADLKTCPAGTWSETTSISEVWQKPRSPSEPLKFRLDADSSAGLVPGNTYYILGEVGATGIAVPNPASAWLREWSLSPADGPAFIAGNPTQFKTLNLGALSDLMEQEVAQGTPKGVTVRRFGFVTRIER